MSIKNAKPADDYKGLLIQFNALKTIVACKEKEVEVYRKQIERFKIERIVQLEAELESEREMNAILTEELELLNKTYKSE
jgi:hypothetical protein